MDDIKLAVVVPGKDFDLTSFTESVTGHKTEWVPVLDLKPGDILMWWTGTVEVTTVYEEEGMAVVVVREGDEVHQWKYKLSDSLSRVVGGRGDPSRR
jgi:hypothetical protein